MSLYAKYLNEITNDRLLEVDEGFAIYRMLPEQKAVYIIDIYVDRDFRKKGLMSLMADKISDIAKKEGATKLLGTVVPSKKNSTESLKAILSYGMKVSSCANDLIVLEKDIG